MRPVVTGVIGSSDVSNSELDRIQRFRADTARRSRRWRRRRRPRRPQLRGAILVRILSNDITNDGAYDGKTGVACQEYVYEVVRAGN